MGVVVKNRENLPTSLVYGSYTYWTFFNISISSKHWISSKSSPKGFNFIWIKKLACLLRRKSSNSPIRISKVQLEFRLIGIVNDFHLLTGREIKKNKNAHISYMSHLLNNLEWNTIMKCNTRSFRFYCFAPNKS